MLRSKQLFDYRLFSRYFVEIFTTVPKIHLLVKTHFLSINKITIWKVFCLSRKMDSYHVDDAIFHLWQRIKKQIYRQVISSDPVNWFPCSNRINPHVCITSLIIFLFCLLDALSIKTINYIDRYQVYMKWQYIQITYKFL